MKAFDIYTIEWMASRFVPYPIKNKFLDSRYEWQRDVNGVEWPYYRFFYHLTEMLRPQLTVELGSYQGTAAAHFAAGWPDHTVITIDHHTDNGDQLNRVKVADVVDNFKNVVYYRGWTTQKLAIENKGKHSLRNVDSAYNDIAKHVRVTGNKINILFIDSWHSYEYTKGDYEAYLPLMSSPGLIICDDISEVEEITINGMMRFWRELPEPKFLNNNLHPGNQFMGFVKV